MPGRLDKEFLDRIAVPEFMEALSDQEKRLELIKDLEKLTSSPATRGIFGMETPEGTSFPEDAALYVKELIETIENSKKATPDEKYKKDIEKGEKDVENIKKIRKELQEDLGSSEGLLQDDLKNVNKALVEGGKYDRA